MRLMTIKVLFTAAGSIGSRHIRNFVSICREKHITPIVDVIRRSDRLLPEDIGTLINKEIRCDFELDSRYDVVFITDETKTHYTNIIKYKDICNHMFIEKPILDDLNYDISLITPKNNSIYYVACPIRFSRYYNELKRVVETQDIYSARIIFSSYMPNWQKGRDYRKSFRCFTSRGGGVDIDSLHEIDYMISLFGMPQHVNRVAGKYSNLEMDAPDLATYIFDYGNKLVEMHLDYFGKTNNRRVEFFTKDDVIIVDYNKHQVEYQCSGELYNYGSDDQFYQSEMNYFISLVTSNGVMENINTLDKAINCLRMAKGYNE